MGIDLGDNGVTVNDGAKTANQPNLLMDYPVVTSATISGSTLTVAGYVGSLPGQSAFAGATGRDLPVRQRRERATARGRSTWGTLTADGNGNFSGNLTVVGMAPGYKHHRHSHGRQQQHLGVRAELHHYLGRRATVPASPSTTAD
ncbi:MAG: hypothetical protein MZV70_66040 [Desulfobacterales bacterium]|nr:hypothetical protein [Desulfobacterales bacterium]